MMSADELRTRRLSVQVGRVSLPNPVMNASGTYGLGDEFEEYGSLSNLGAFVTKSLSLHPREGNSGSNLVMTPFGGLLNSVGLRNPGVQSWVKTHYPQLIRDKVRVVASVWAESEEQLFEAASVLASCDDLIAIEVNLSCPNAEDPHLIVSHDPIRVGSYVAAAAGASPIDVWAKLAPSTPDVVACAQAAEGSGAAAVVLVNTLSAMSVEIETMTATLSGGYGGMSGPPLHPIALRAVHQVHSALPRLPIVGVGGIMDCRTALNMIAVGASAIQVGTASFRDPRAPHRILRKMDKWLEKRNLNATDVIGSIRTERLPTED